MMTAIWITAAIFVTFVMFIVWGMCAAAKRGDEMTEDCTEFSHDWQERRS